MKASNMHPRGCILTAHNMHPRGCIMMHRFGCIMTLGSLHPRPCISNAPPWVQQGNTQQEYQFPACTDVQAGPNGLVALTTWLPDRSLCSPKPQTARAKNEALR